MKIKTFINSHISFFEMKKIIKLLDSPDRKYKLTLEATANIFNLLAGFGPEYSIKIKSNSLPKLLRGLLNKKIYLGENYFDTANRIGTKYNRITIIPKLDFFEVKKEITGTGKIGSCSYVEVDKYDYSGRKL